MNEPIAEEVVRLANRTTALTLLTMLFLTVGIVALPITFRDNVRPPLRVLSAMPAAVATASGLAAAWTRAQWRSARQRLDAELAHASESSAPGTR
jgi:hypothetical protein